MELRTLGPAGSGRGGGNYEALLGGPGPKDDCTVRGAAFFQRAFGTDYAARALWPAPTQHVPGTAPGAALLQSDAEEGQEAYYHPTLAAVRVSERAERARPPLEAQPPFGSPTYPASLFASMATGASGGGLCGAGEGVRAELHDADALRLQGGAAQGPGDKCHPSAAHAALASWRKELGASSRGDPSGAYHPSVARSSLAGWRRDPEGSAGGESGGEYHPAAARAASASWHRNMDSGANGEHADEHRPSVARSSSAGWRREMGSSGACKGPGGECYPAAARAASAGWQQDAHSGAAEEHTDEYHPSGARSSSAGWRRGLEASAGGEPGGEFHPSVARFASAGWQRRNLEGHALRSEV